MKKALKKIRKEIKINSPFIHALTNIISINDCANIILAVGAKAIMAKHIDEVSAITKNADALLINIGNISDADMLVMEKSAEVANRYDIPIVFDAVGVACSDIRLSFAEKIITKYSPNIVKGNISEMSALLKGELCAKGIDVSSSDAALTIDERILLAQTLADNLKTTIVMTGKTDIVTNGEKTFLIKNGDELMSFVTGTGCMLGALICTFLNKNKEDALTRTVLAASYFAVAGELAAMKANGPGSFKGIFFDYIYSLSFDEYKKNVAIYEV